MVKPQFLYESRVKATKARPPIREGGGRLRYKGRSQKRRVHGENQPASDRCPFRHPLGGGKG